MIGMINLSTEGPMEFYASPVAKIDEPSSKLQRAGRPTALANIDELPPVSFSSKPQPSPATMEQIQSSLDVFSQRQIKPSHGYCPDGRKCQDGRPVIANSPSKLWEELLIRMMVNKIHGEIASPVDQLQSMEKTFGKMSMLDRQTSRSQPSLCSEDKSTAARFCDACSSISSIHEEPVYGGKRIRSFSEAARSIDEAESDSESALDDIIADMLTKSAPGSTHNLFFDDCS